MKHEKILLLLDDICKIESDLSIKHGEMITLSFNVRTYSLDAICEATNEAFKYSGSAVPLHKTDIRRKNNTAPAVLFRHLFMYIACESGYTHQEIGEYIGKNHSTVTFGKNKISKRMSKNSTLVCGQYKLIKEKLKK